MYSLVENPTHLPTFGAAPPPHSHWDLGLVSSCSWWQEETVEQASLNSFSPLPIGENPSWGIQWCKGSCECSPWWGSCAHEHLYSLEEDTTFTRLGWLLHHEQNKECAQHLFIKDEWEWKKYKKGRGHFTFCSEPCLQWSHSSHW